MSNVHMQQRGPGAIVFGEAVVLLCVASEKGGLFIFVPLAGLKYYTNHGSKYLIISFCNTTDL